MLRDHSESLRVPVSPHRLFLSLLVGWPAIVCAALTSRIFLSIDTPSVSEYAVWFFLTGAPVATYLMLLRSRPEGSIAKVLYDAKRDN